MSFKAFDHLVVRVEDIDAGIATYRDKLGLTLERRMDSDALGVKQAIFPLPGGGFIELVAPLTPESPVGRALQSRGEGLHSCVLAVDDLAATVASLKANGVQLIGEGGPVVFVHPKAAHGIMLQLVERK
jgi:methylmalonyl-CoA/ethylmalonyl-CoA epimerase